MKTADNDRYGMRYFVSKNVRTSESIALWQQTIDAEGPVRSLRQF